MDFFKQKKETELKDVEVLTLSLLSKMRTLPTWAGEWDMCSGLVHWEDPKGLGGEGGGRGDRDGEYMAMADSCQCMTKTTTIL